ncbi:MAG: hypothetical protein HYS98_07405 [Deltaproteobacteria bacterium]|nr:hypothetical protein [Deltaproteobacteria bacterium]
MIKYVLLIVIPAFALATSQKEIETYFKYHEASAHYHLTFIPQDGSLEKSTLHVLPLSLQYSLIPKLKLLSNWALLHRSYSSSNSSTTTVSNPSVGLFYEVLTGIDRDFPTFVYLESNVKFPIHGQTGVTFNRTDIRFSARILKEVYYFTLGAEAGYVAKWDHSSKGHGNEFFSTLESVFHNSSGINFKLDFEYRYVAGYKDKLQTLSSQSIFILTPEISYKLNSDWQISASVSAPLRDAEFDKIATAFGDFESPGLLDWTYTVGVNYRF